MLKITKLLDELVFVKNNGDKSIFKKNNSDKAISRKNNSNIKIDRFDVSGNIKLIKKVGKSKN